MYSCSNAQYSRGHRRPPTRNGYDANIDLRGGPSAHGYQANYYDRNDQLRGGPSAHGYQARSHDRNDHLRGGLSASNTAHARSVENRCRNKTQIGGYHVDGHDHNEYSVPHRGQNATHARQDVEKAHHEGRI